MKKFIVVLSIGLFLFFSCEKEPINLNNNPHQETQDTTLNISSIEAGTLPEIFLHLDNGNTLQFYSLDEEEQLYDDFLVVEEQECESCSALKTIGNLGIKDFNAYDFYWAFSKPGTEIPVKLEALQNYSSQPDERAQGWAIEELSNQVDNSNSRSNTVACNNNTFDNSIAGGFLDNPTFKRFDATPNTHPNIFANDCLQIPHLSGCAGQPRYLYRATSAPTKKWAGKICARSVQANNYLSNHWINWTVSGASFQSYYGPRISFQIRGSNGWRIINSGNTYALYEIPPNKTKVYSWYIRTNGRYYHRVAVNHAKHYDEFDFMMDSE